LLSRGAGIGRVYWTKPRICLAPGLFRFFVEFGRLVVNRNRFVPRRRRGAQKAKPKQASETEQRGRAADE
jgi:hypothetical protein